MNKKASLDLSINAIIIIVLSIAMLSGGVSLMYQFIGGAEDIKSQMDHKTEMELERLLINEGQMVALPLHTATIERGESHVFGIGILNIHEKDEFWIEITERKAVGLDNDGITVDYGSWLFYNSGKITLEKNQNYKESIMVVVPKESAPKGQYFYNAIIKTDQGQYGNTQSFVVTVP